MFSHCYLDVGHPCIPSVSGACTAACNLAHEGAVNRKSLSLDVTGFLSVVCFLMQIMVCLGEASSFTCVQFMQAACCMMPLWSVFG